MLEVNNLKKRYGSTQAVDGASFRVEKGQCVGLLGPNGAGKTTTVSMICGLIEPDTGEVKIDGRPMRGDTDPTKRALGLVTQEIALYDELTARQNLELFGSLYGLSGVELGSAITEAVELVGLTERARDRVKTYSGGMKRRLNLAAALLHDPEWIILDEPTAGVDPQSRNAIFENLESLRSRGKTLIYTTHYMEEAERLCDRIVIMDAGRVVADDDLRGLLRRLPATNKLLIELDGGDSDHEKLLAGLKGVPGVVSVQLDASVLSVSVNDLTQDAPRILGWLVAQSASFSHLASERADLEAVFLALTGRSLRDS
jgi:ABC-2 type transport system ATP-binding protein